MIFLGIDPGLNGYLAFINEDGVHDFAPMPTIASVKGSRSYDIDGLLKALIGYHVTFAVIERQQVFPKQGSVSGFTTGYGYGMLRTALHACGIPYNEVLPRMWKKEFGITGDHKAQKRRSIEVAKSLYPGIDFKPHERGGRHRVADHNKAEALLLSVVARRLWRGGASTVVGQLARGCKVVDKMVSQS